MNDKFLARATMVLWAIAVVPFCFGFLSRTPEGRLANSVGGLLISAGGLAAVKPLSRISKG